MESINKSIEANLPYLSLHARNLYNTSGVRPQSLTVTQNIIKNIFTGPMKERRFFGIGETGSGKTFIMAHAILSQFIYNEMNGVRPENNAALVVTYAPNVLLRDLAGIIALRQSGNLTAPDDLRPADSIISNIETMGYRMLENRLFLSGSEKITEYQFKPYSYYSPEIEQMIAAGQILIDQSFIAEIMKFQIIICDEFHLSHSGGYLNQTGQAIAYIMDKFPHITIVVVDATPLMTFPAEIVPIINFLTGGRHEVADLLHPPHFHRPIYEKIEAIASTASGQVFTLFPMSGMDVPPIHIHGRYAKEIGLDLMNYFTIEATPLQKKWLAALPKNSRQAHLAETAALE